MKRLAFGTGLAVLYGGIALALVGYGLCKVAS